MPEKSRNTAPKAGDRLLGTHVADKTKRFHIDRRADQVATTISSTDESDEALNTAGAAQLLGVSTQWLEIQRGNGLGPKFTRLSPRMIRYLRSDLISWLRERAHRSTAEYRKESA